MRWQPTPGWRLLGKFPEGDAGGVGSWLLHAGRDSLLLELPPGLGVGVVRDALAELGCELRFIMASHSHEDHYDAGVAARVRRAFPEAAVLPPWAVAEDRRVTLGGEPVYLVPAPKHSADDVVTVFRGAAMTGDIELGTYASVNDEVDDGTKRASFARLREFPARAGYRVHTVFSAHLNDYRTAVEWPALFPA